MSDIRNIKVCVVGLGYVGLPLACLFASKYRTIGFDIDSQRVASLRHCHDVTGEVSDDKLNEAILGNLTFTSDIAAIADSTVYVVAVPTPVDVNNRPDLTPILNATRTVGGMLAPGNVVVYESTVYPGVTEEECVPLLQEVSGLHYNEDFFVGYSPERINPGDKTHPVESICKVTSGSTPQIADFVDTLYASVLKNGTFKVSSIKVAEASKIVENSQRDVNIAFVNELAKIFNAMGIDTNEVLDAASTKWNFINMRPGLVGGHCISVDPYYLIAKAQVYGVFPRVMSSARRLNDSMGNYVASQVIKSMNLKGLLVKDAFVLILGFSFKENCPDTRNTKVIDIYESLSEYTSNIIVYDPYVDVQTVKNRYGIEVVTTLPQRTFDAGILAVAHSQFNSLNLRRLVPQPGILYDVKGVLPIGVADARL